MLGPVLLIVLGVLFLLNNLYPDVYRFSRMWPVILIVIGLVKIMEFFRISSGPGKGSATFEASSETAKTAEPVDDRKDIKA